MALTFIAVALSESLEFHAQPVQRPIIDRVDPPNWWPSLPNPMVLVYGRNLSNVEFAVNVRGVRMRILRREVSANGHYAFLWLGTKTAEPQELEITASNSAGSSEIRFELKRRLPADGRYQGFNPADVIYLVMTDRFADGNLANDQPGYAPNAARGWHGGDFAGIREHLDYLQKLGISTLWLTPILSNGNMPESYHGYAAVDLYGVDSHFGSLGEYRHLAEDLHARGMKIIFDIVPNHIGVQHPWVLDPPAPGWFHGSIERHDHVQSNFAVLVDPHAPVAAQFDITHGWFTDAMPDLNQENPLVATYLIQNAVWWIETAGLDGLRIDTFPYVDRRFWSEFHRVIHENYPDLTTVGEVFNSEPTITSYFAGRVSHDGIDTGLDTLFDFPTYFTLRDVLLHGKSMAELRSLLAEDHLYPHPERLVTFFGNHDTARFRSEPGSNITKLELAFALLATLRGTPEIYSGDEIAMAGREDPDNRRDFPGGFKSSTHNAFTKDGRKPEENEVFNWVSQLFHMRQTHPAIAGGAEQDLFADSSSFVFLRGIDLNTGCLGIGDRERILVFANNSDQPRPLELETAKTGLERCTTFTPLLPRSASAIKVADAKILVTLEPGATIYAVR